MGMSASQARFLGLTARKSNVEFQGQQVNQQRTSLANESSGLFNQMLALQVPTPPSATDFYSMSYTFNGLSANESFRILKWDTSSAGAEGSYNVDVYKTINDGKQEKVFALPEGTTFSGTEGNYSLTIPNSNITNRVLTKSDKDVMGRKEGEKDYIPSYTYLYYDQATNEQRLYYISEELIKASVANGGNLPTDATATQSYYKADNTTEKMTLEGVTMITDETGRFIGMKYTDPETRLEREVELTIKEIKDDEGYDKAMQDYNYKKMLYDRTIQDINTRTEVIQQQDKTLELNLKQLDTEQEAISTEIEAVKKVIEKNVTDTFKTFA